MLLFVYGTMLKGGRNHDRLDRAEFIGDYITYPCFEMYMRWTQGGYYAPIAICEPDSSCSMWGEIYRVADRDITEIDFFEGSPDTYCRKPLPLMVGVEYPQCYMYMGELTDEDRFYRITPEDGIVRFRP